MHFSFNFAILRTTAGLAILFFLVETSAAQPALRATLKTDGHRGAVTCVSYGPHGNRSNRSDASVTLWDAARLTIIHKLLGHSDTVSSVAFSPNGRVLASASWDKTIKLWEVASGKNIETLTGHTRHVSSVAFGPDGTLLASASWDKTLKLWDAATGKNLATLTGHTKPIYSIAFSPDGKLLASAGEDNTVRIWDVVNRKNIAVLTDYTSAIKSVAFSPDGQMLASSDYGGVIKLWDVADWTSTTFIEVEYAVAVIAFNPNEQMLVSGAGLGASVIELWDPKTKSKLATLKHHKHQIRSLAFSPTGNILASASDDQTIKLWNLTPEK